MHETNDTSGRDDAARAIRDALPAADQATTDRIAQRIADGMREQQRAERQVRRPGRRRIGVLRPSLAVGAACVAGAVALLAPGQDADPAKRGLLELGPDAAAADVLRAAGDIASEQDWHALRPGEYHHTRRVEYAGAGGRIDVVSEQWLGADGSRRVRITETPGAVPSGETYYVPALDCSAADTVTMVRVPHTPSPDSIDDAMKTAACSGQPVFGGVVAKVEDGDEVLDAPPAGAYVELPPWELIALDSRVLKFGDEVFEGSSRQEVPPGIALEATAGPDAASTVKVTFTPVQLPPSTRWVARTAEPVVVVEDTFDPAEAKSRAIAEAFVPSMLSWEVAFTLDQLEQLPTDAVALERSVRAAARRGEQAYVRSIAAKGADASLPVNPDRDASTLQMVTDLLANAPVSPDVRRGLFEVLASLTRDGRSPRVDQDAKLPNGERAIAVSFQLVVPKEFMTPEMEDDEYRLLFDPETAELRASVLDLGDRENVTTWDVPSRTTER